MQARIFLTAIGCLLLMEHSGQVVGAEPDLSRLKVTSIGEIGPPSLRVNLVIIGDGYIAEDFKPGARWEVDTQRLVKNFFEKLPFKSLRSLFNVFLVEVVSEERGADSSPSNDSKKTALNCTYGQSGIARLLVCQDDAAALVAAGNAPKADILLVIVNDQRYGGSGGFIGKLPGPVTSSQPTAFDIAIHELGHSFAGLADEYVDEEIIAQYPLPPSGDLAEPNVTLPGFFDDSTKESLIESLKWGHFLDDPNFEKLYGKGLYEGGYYRAKGVFRPAVGCAMGSQAGSGGFCFVCTDEITKAIYKTSGRGPGGGVFPSEVSPMKGPLRRARYAYGLGIFGNAKVELDRVAKKKDLTASQSGAIATLRKGMDLSREEAVAKTQQLLRDGAFAAADEKLSLLEQSFKGTPGESKVTAVAKAIRREAGFKKELNADRDLLKLEQAVRNQRFAAGSQAAMKKLFADFKKRHTGTKAEAKAKALEAKTAKK